VNEVIQLRAFIQKYVGFFLLLVGLGGLFVYLLVDQSGTEENIQSPTHLTLTTAPLVMLEQRIDSSDEVVFVDIKGEVLFPGVYPIKGSYRIYEAIVLAGGLTTNADVSQINLARKVADEMVIFVPKRADPPTSTDTTSAPPEPKEWIQIDVKGAVVHPGVYTLEAGERVIGAIHEAGGVTKDADLDGLNLARVLTDGEEVVVPRKPESITTPTVTPRRIYVEIRGMVAHPGIYHMPEDASVKDLINDAGGLLVDADLSQINFNMPLVSGMRIIIPTYTEPEAGTTPIESDPPIDEGKININTATLDELQTLKGIGMVLGQRIIDYRAEYGNFSSIEDIMHVSGIKESIYDQIREFITVGNG
jgi:competence protein ComEA